ncbi:hypothetical protein ACXXCT_12690 [Bordetella bronchiseptica]
MSTFIHRMVCLLALLALVAGRNARANEAIKADPGAAGALFAATFDLPDTVARDAVGNYAFSLRMPQAVQAQMKQSAAFLKDERIIRRPVDVDAFLDLALID